MGYNVKCTVNINYRISPTSKKVVKEYCQRLTAREMYTKECHSRANDRAQ